MNGKAVRLSYGLCLSLLLIGSESCIDRDLKPVIPCTVSGFVRQVEQSSIDKIDLLFVVDSSNSMADEQVLLVDELPRLVNVMVTGKINDDDVQDFPPPKDLHIGVVTTDGGLGGYTFSFCPADEPYGDEGILRDHTTPTVYSANQGMTQGIPVPAECSTPLSQKGYMERPNQNYISYQPDAGTKTAAQVSADFGCISRVGDRGCGVEQTLDAMLRAITPAESSIKFLDMTNGQSNTANEGFLRPDALLAVVILSDEDDCSVKTESRDFLDLGNPTYGGAETRSSRCYQPNYANALQPISRYVDGLKAAKGDYSNRIVVAEIIGVRKDLVPEVDPASIGGQAPAVNYAAVLADDSMQVRVTPGGTSTDPYFDVVPSCSVSRTGGEQTALPPRRLVQFAQAFGENAIVQSICDENYTGAMTVIIQKIADALRGACLPRPLNRDAQGRVNCDVLEKLPATGEFTACSQVQSLGRDPEPVRVEDGQQVCRINQSPVTGGSVTQSQALGWYYDDFTQDVKDKCQAFTAQQRISFVPGAEPVAGARVRLECLQPVPDDTPEQGGGVGTPCNPSSNTCANFNNPAFRGSFFCEDQTRTCQIMCSNNSDCPATFVCDTEAKNGPPRCVNPSC